MPHDFMPGLDGVPAARSKISDVNGETGVLEYRGIRIEDLAAKSNFLETACCCYSAAFLRAWNLRNSPVI